MFINSGGTYSDVAKPCSFPKPEKVDQPTASSSSLFKCTGREILIPFWVEFFHLVSMDMKRGRFGWLVAGGLFLATPVWADMAPIKLEVDATDAPRNLVHTRLHIPASPGPLTLYYPKWIPGEHSPSGPVNNVTGLKFSANGQPLEWQRDAVDMFTFHLNGKGRVTR